MTNFTGSIQQFITARSGSSRRRFRYDHWLSVMARHGDYAIFYVNSGTLTCSLQLNVW